MCGCSAKYRTQSLALARELQQKQIQANVAKKVGVQRPAVAPQRPAVAIQRQIVAPKRPAVVNRPVAVQRPVVVNRPAIRAGNRTVARRRGAGVDAAGLVAPLRRR